MSVRLTKPFEPLVASEIERVPGHLGVFELADDAGRIVRIGYAGGHSLFGLRSAIEATAANSAATQFRYESNTAYLTRCQELLMCHVADHGALPAENDPTEFPRLGRLSVSKTQGDHSGS